MKAFGIRHLSPAGAYYVRKFLDLHQPDVVFIEGPADFNPLMERLTFLICHQIMSWHFQIGEEMKKRSKKRFLCMKELRVRARMAISNIFGREILNRQRVYKAI